MTPLPTDPQEREEEVNRLARLEIPAPNQEFAILYVRHSDMEEFIIGTFPTKQAAQDWMANDADKKAGSDRHKIDGNGDDYLVVTDDNGDAEHEWTIKPTVTP